MGFAAARAAKRKADGGASCSSQSSDTSSSSSGSSAPPLLFTPAAAPTRRAWASDGTALFAGLGAGLSRSSGLHTSLTHGSSSPRTPVATAASPPVVPGTPASPGSDASDDGAQHSALLWRKVMAPASITTRNSRPISSLSFDPQFTQAPNKAPKFQYTYAPSSKTSSGHPSDRGKGKGKDRLPLVYDASDAQEDTPLLSTTQSEDPRGKPGAPSSTFDLLANVSTWTPLTRLTLLVCLWVATTTFLSLWNRHLFATSNRTNAFVARVASLAFEPSSSSSLVEIQRMHRQLAFPPLFVSALQAGTASVVAALLAAIVLPFVRSESPLHRSCQIKTAPRAGAWNAAVLALTVLYAAETSLMAQGLRHAHLATVGLGRLPAGVVAMSSSRLLMSNSASATNGAGSALLALVGSALVVDGLFGGLGASAFQLHHEGATGVLVLLASAAAGLRWAVVQALLFPSSPSPSTNERSYRPKSAYPLLLIAYVAFLASIGLGSASGWSEPGRESRRTWSLLTGQWGEHGPPKRLPVSPHWSVWTPDTTTWAWLVLALIPGTLEAGAWATELALLKLEPLGRMAVLDPLRTALQVAAACVILEDDDAFMTLPVPGWQWAKGTQLVLGPVFLLLALIVSNRSASRSETEGKQLQLCSGTKPTSFGTIQSVRIDPPAVTKKLSAADRARASKLAEEVNLMSWDGCGTSVCGDGYYDDSVDS